MAKNNITTIKLEKQTKKRLDNLKEHPRETYNELINKTLNIINITIKSPISGAKIFRRIKAKKNKKSPAQKAPEVYQEYTKDNSQE